MTQDLQNKEFLSVDILASRAIESGILQIDELFFTRLLVTMLLVVGLVLGLVGMLVHVVLTPPPPTPYIHPEWMATKFA